MQKYKTNGNRGLFDEEMTCDQLSEIGNPLEKINLIVDFEIFRKSLEAGVLNLAKKSNAGAKPFLVFRTFSGHPHNYL